jgi:hypothetical protein
MLSAELEKKYAEHLRRIGEEIRKIQKEITLEREAETNDSGPVTSPQE